MCLLLCQIISCQMLVSWMCDDIICSCYKLECVLMICINKMECNATDTFYYSQVVLKFVEEQERAAVERLNELWHVSTIAGLFMWGYFAYMSIDSLMGNEFWERLFIFFIRLVEVSNT